MKQFLMEQMANMMIACEKAAFLVSKRQDEKLTCKENFNLTIHLATCKFCSLYAKQINAISENIKEKKFTPGSPHQELTLDPTRKKEMETLVNNKLK